MNIKKSKAIFNLSVALFLTSPYKYIFDLNYAVTNEMTDNLFKLFNQLRGSHI